jgi:TorA maturation chaperone TorD
LEHINLYTIQLLRLEHDRVFGHTISSDCPPYETQYGAGIIFAQTQRMGDITAFYRAFGVQISPGAHERHDHIAAELEFMSILAFREAVAIVDNDREHLTDVRDAERKFLMEHLATWALSFAERLGRKGRTATPHDGGYYVALAECLDGLVRDELRCVHVTPESLGHIEPGKIEFEPEGCSFACGPAGEPVLANLPGFEV